MAKDGLLDYLQVVLKEVSSRFTPAPAWWTQDTTDVPPPNLGKKPGYRCADVNGEGVYCARCQEGVDRETREQEEERHAKEAKQKASQGSNDRMRERMREKARAAKRKKEEGGKK